MVCSNFMVGIKVILKNNNNEFLVLKAQDNGPMAGYYDLPGGRVDSDEVGVEFSDIAAREITEECGDIQYRLSSNPTITFSWLWPKEQPITFVYLEADYESGEIIISEEHTGMKWIALEQSSIDRYLTSYHRKALTEYINRK